MDTVKVLIADDDRLNLALLEDGLKSSGYEVLKAEDGAAAVEICQQQTPDIAILDIRMPKMNGMDAGEIINKEYRVPVIFLTAHSDESFVKSATELGACGYMVKPIQVEQLIPMIKTTITKFKDVVKLQKSNENLTFALNKDRNISEAIGILLGTGSIKDGEEAFDCLRNYARKHEKKVALVASELVNKVSDANKLVLSITKK